MELTIDNQSKTFEFSETSEHHAMILMNLVKRLDLVNQARLVHVVKLVKLVNLEKLVSPASFVNLVKQIN